VRRQAGTVDSRAVYSLRNLCPAETVLDESELVRQARRGDEAAWETLVRLHQEGVFRLAYLLVGDADDARDVAQEAFLRAFRAFAGFDATRPLRPWLLGITAHLASNRRRAAGRYLMALRRLVQTAPPAPTIEGLSGQHLQAQALWQAVRRLDPHDQQIVYLRYFLDLSVAETAEALGVAAGTVKSRLSRALQRLRLIVQAEFPDLQKDSTDG
jgi:RNA polymerase sigma-70 factor (ECF subfamily)